MGRFVILVMAVSSHVSGWAVASDNFAGIWTGTVNGQPAVTLRIENPKASHCGEATLYAQADDNGTWRVAGALTQPMTSCTTKAMFSCSGPSITRPVVHPTWSNISIGSASNRWARLFFVAVVGTCGRIRFGLSVSRNMGAVSRLLSSHC